jgi:thiosulfate/3-mercaptopyruvate sulfurtransferase
MLDKAPVLVDPRWLAAHLDETDLFVLDARSVLGDPEKSRAAYRAGHIPGAGYINVDADLSGPPGGAQGGARPLPDAASLAETLGALGIDPSGHIVVYDETTGIAAARAWWVLRYMGLERVSVLDGGLGVWQAAGGALETGDAPARQPTSVRLSPRRDWVVDVDAVSALGQAPEADSVLADARGAPAYAGTPEAPGHLPGAINLPAAALLDARGRMLAVPQLLERLAPLSGKGDVVAYCGSGVSACGLLLGMAAAGMNTGRLYPGGWSEWSARQRPQG